MHYIDLNQASRAFWQRLYVTMFLISFFFSCSMYPNKVFLKHFRLFWNTLRADVKTALCSDVTPFWWDVFTRTLFERFAKILSPNQPSLLGRKILRNVEFQLFSKHLSWVSFTRYHHSEVGSNYSTTSAIEARIMDSFQKDFLALLGTFQ